MSIIRIDKFIADCGEGTRSSAKKLIAQGKVHIDGIKASDSSMKIDTEKNIVTICGRKINYSKYAYIMMNKPKGVVSAVTDKKYKTVMDLIKKEDLRKGMFPMGRLDIDTVGLLIITNNGKLSHNTLSPKKHVVKKYYAEVLGRLDESDVKKFEEGMVLNGVTLKSAVLDIVDTGEISKAYVCISEGKFHQIKEMFRKTGKKVVYLKRVMFGSIKLDENLCEGDYRALNDNEIKLLNEYSQDI